MKKLLILILGILLVMPLINAVSIGTFQRSSDVELYQTCNNCTYCNLTAIKYPNSTNILTNVAMNNLGTYYYYVLDENYTGVLGSYIYCYDCGNPYEKATGCIEFEITESGYEKPDGVVIVLFTILFLIILCGMVWLLLYTIFHFIQLDFDAKDLTYNLSAYFFLWGVYALGKYYIGNELINNILLWMIEVGAVTAVIVPLCAFVISYIKGGLEDVKGHSQKNPY